LSSPIGRWNAGGFSGRSRKIRINVPSVATTGDGQKWLVVGLYKSNIVYP
jgi:hypothetical protein